MKKKNLVVLSALLLLLGACGSSNLSSEDSSTGSSDPSQSSGSSQSSTDPSSSSTTSQSGETIRIYYLNSTSWAAVNGYAYDIDETKFLGEWPGTAATKEASSNWWYVDVNYGTTLNFSIIFNNGSGSQAAGAAINEAGKVYTTLSSSSAFASKQLAEESLIVVAGFTVNFLNSGNWPSVYAYQYGAAGKPTEVLGGWPGTALSIVGDGPWYTLHVPLDAEEHTPNIIFHNSLDTTETQRCNVYFDEDTKLFITAAGRDFASKALAEASLTDPDPDYGDGFTVYFLNSNDWPTVKVYQWADAPNPHEILGAWPGTEMTATGEGKWYSLLVPADVGPYQHHLIFMNGSNDKQRSEVFLETDAELYVTVNAAAFATKALAEASLSDPEPDYGESITIYYLNGNNWPQVNAYQYGSKPSPTDKLGGWPGTPMTATGDGNWYSIVVPVDPASYAFNLIFFNSAADAQRAEALFNSRASVYTAADGQLFPTKALAEAH